MLDLRAYDPVEKRELIFSDVLEFTKYKLAQMEAASGDQDKLRLYADDIWLQSLRAIAEGHAAPRMVATLALETQKYQPSRYFGF